jgi:hypothetical protein
LELAGRVIDASKKWLAASIYQADEYLTVPEQRRESYRTQVLSGIPPGNVESS